MAAAGGIIGLIGIGNLARFIVEGAAGAGYRFILSPRNRGHAADLQRRFGAEIAPDNQRVCDLADLIVVCLPAATGVAVLADLQFRQGQTVLSAMAGVGAEVVQRAVAPATAYCTMMPGHANALGIGPSILFPPSPACEAFLSHLGPVHPLGSAEEFAAASAFGALSGASFPLMTSMIAWFERNGLDPRTARELVAETLIGNASVMLRADAGLDEIAAGVATPGGITELCLDTLHAHGNLEQWHLALDAVLDVVRGPNAASSRSG